MPSAVMQTGYTDTNSNKKISQFLYVMQKRYMYFQTTSSSSWEVFGKQLRRTQFSFFMARLYKGIFTLKKKKEERMVALVMQKTLYFCLMSIMLTVKNYISYFSNILKTKIQIPPQPKFVYINRVLCLQHNSKYVAYSLVMLFLPISFDKIRTFL